MNNRFVLIVSLAMMVAMVLMPLRASAQIVDPRVGQLEEQIRRLNGQIEELNFQILQMQDQMRRQQEDLEFRLQLLEEQQSGSAAPVIGDDEQTDIAAAQDEPAAPKGDRLDNVAAQITAGLDQSASTAPQTGAPPRSLGTLKVDGSGNVVSSSIDFSNEGINQSLDPGKVASVTLTGTPDDIYSEGYRHILNGDYGLAEAVFASMIDTYPDDPLVADAKFWMGEAMLSQGRFEDAAEVFIDLRSSHPTSGKGPETFLKIGSIMASLGNRDVACATFADALTTFEGMSNKMRDTIAQEQRQAQC